MAAGDIPSGSAAVAYLVALIGAIGTLGTAAFALVDASKASGNGGVSNVGFRDLERVLERFKDALDRAIGAEDWRFAVHAHWINGRPRDQQKAIVKSLIRLGLDQETAPALAKAGHVAPDALAAVVGKLERGEQLLEVDVNVLGRFDASIDAQLDAAFDRADQRYRNVARVWAGVAAVVLSVVAAAAMRRWSDLPMAVVVGVLAVPLSPIAKDLASSLSAAARAVGTPRP